MAHYSPWHYFGLISPLLQFLQEIPVCMSPRRPQSKFQACHIACVKNSVAQNISTKFDLKKSVKLTLLIVVKRYIRAYEYFIYIAIYRCS